MPALDSVQSGNLTISAGSGTTVNVTISSVDTSRAIAMYTLRSADVNFRDARHIFRADLSSSTNLRLIRQESGSATNVELYWTVVEFDSTWGGSLQVGSLTCDASTEDITISAVDLAASFPLLYHTTDEFQLTAVAQPRPTLTSTTNLRLSFASAPSSNDCIVQYQVIEFDAADADVQSGTAVASNSYSNDATISSVDTDKTLVLAWSDIVAGSPGRNYARSYLASATSIEGDCQNRGTAPNWNNTWFSVEMLDGSVVESGVVAIANGNTAPGTAPSWASAMTNGAVFAHKSQPNSYITTTGNDNSFPNSIQASIALDSPQDSLTVTRQGTVNDIELGWQVIEWAASGGAPTLVIADALHAHTADNLTLTQQHVLTVADASHAHLADGITLTQNHVLAIADALHAHAADNVVLSVEGTLAVADALHAHAADNLALTQTHVLAVADALHAHLADNLTLVSGGTTLEIADALHAHLADGLALTQLHILTVSDALHAHLADTLTLSVPGAAILHNRVLLVRGENRTLVILPENRTLSVH